MILLLDNYDSFVHNLARYVRELGGEPRVVRNDALDVTAIAALAPTHILISPGPCTPAEAGVSVEVVRRLGPVTPILGVCLGHQVIGAAYGARIVRSLHPMHGKTSAILHDASGVLAHVPSPFRATRYHSLAIERASVPADLLITATAEDDGEIMAVRHTRDPVHGVQFHPESVLTEHGHSIVRNFLELSPRG
jgi:anthranilate synthase component 2